MDRGGERTAPAGVPAFVPTGGLLSAADVARALRRMAHEIAERNPRLDDVSIIGVQRGGRPFAVTLGALLNEIGALSVPVGLLDVALYRDDVSRSPLATPAPTTIDHDLTERVVVLVDDVLFTGRTIRAALNALSDWGRPRAIQLAVMVDRGHRELPIRADFVGKNLPSALDEVVVATLDGVGIGRRGAP
ncbi:MAG: bifunctional pyr operon transcriptional regulator/uracil phosphoribosyltransferase PyrR [Acidimicrobiales bacterium]